MVVANKFHKCGISHASTTTLRRILTILRCSRGGCSRKEITTDCPGSRRQIDDGLKFLITNCLITKNKKVNGVVIYRVVNNNDTGETN